MTGYQAFEKSNEFAAELGVTSEKRRVLCDVDIDFLGYVRLARYCWSGLVHKWEQRFPGVDMPCEGPQFLSVSVGLLFKRISFVRSDVLNEAPIRNGMGKRALIHGAIFDRLYMYGSVNVGTTTYLPTFSGIKAALQAISMESRLSVNEKTGIVVFSPTDEEKQAYTEMMIALEPYVVMSQLLPSQSTGTLGMLMHVTTTGLMNTPWCVSENAAGADAALAAIAPDSLRALKIGALRVILQDVWPFVFHIPYSAIEDPENAVRSFVGKFNRSTPLFG